MATLLSSLVAVLVVGAAPATAEETPSVAFLSPVDGETVGGEVPLTVQTTGAVESVSFATAVTEAGPWKPVSSAARDGDVWNTTWESRPYRGNAVVRVTADGPAGTASADVHLVVANPDLEVDVSSSRAVLSPNRDGRKDDVRVTVATTNAAPAEVEVEIVDPEGRVARVWRLSHGASEATTIRWNGRTGGEVVRDGRYIFVGRAVDEFGATDEATRPVVVDKTSPRLRWRSASPEPLTDEGAFTFRFVVSDRAPAVDVAVELARGATAVSRGRRRVDPGRARIVLDARDERGRPLYPGLYRARIVARDDAGNVRTSPARRLRVHRAVAARVVRRVEGAGARIALTFDDCYQGGAWAEILRVLKRRGARASFFCNGQEVAEHPEQARRTVRDGHSIGSHSWDHARQTGRSVEQVVASMRADQNVWWRVARATTAPYFRPPFGAYDANVVAAAGRTGHGRVVLWDVDPSDYRRPGTGELARRVTTGARGGSIVVLHAIDSTADALPAILDGLERRGLRAVTLDDLFRAGR